MSETELLKRIEALEWDLEWLHHRLEMIEARPITGLDCSSGNDKQPRVYDDRLLERCATVTSSPVTLTNGTKWSNEAGGFVE